MVLRMLRRSINQLQPLQIKISQMSLSRPPELLDYRVVNGCSGRRNNNFDCGVFSIVNIKRMVCRPRDHAVNWSPTMQELMTPYRARIINKLFDQNNAIADIAYVCYIYDLII